MSPAGNTQLAAAARSQYGLVVGIGLALLGPAVMLGWAFDIGALKSVVAGRPTMKLNTAFCLTLLGVALIAQARAWTGAVRGCAAAVTLIALLSLWQHATGTDLGIDQWLVSERPSEGGGRMALFTAIALAALGFALLLGTASTSAVAWLRDTGAVVAGVIGLGGLAGHLYEFQPLRSLGTLVATIALHTTIALVLAAVATIALAPASPIARIVCAERAGGRFARALLPVAVVLPIGAGWVRIAAQDAGLFGIEVGVLWMVLASIVGFAAATLLGAARLNAVDDRLHATNARLETTVAERTAELQEAIRRLEEQAQFAHGMIDTLTESVAERQRAEETLRQREASYRLMFEANPQPMFVYDPADLSILGVNDAAVHRYGWSREEFRALTLADLHPPVELGPVREKVGTLGPGFLTGIAWNHRTRSGESMEVEVSSHGVHFEGRNGRLVLVHEVTERNRIERELRAKNAELERFTYTVSHDLKSPLVTVRTFAGYLQDDIAAGDAARIAADLGYITHAADKMAHLLDELLELSRLGRTRDLPVLTSYRELAEEALRLTAGAVSRSGARVEFEPGDVPIRGDRTRLIEIWQNLIDNAAKFMGSQPAPTIRLGHRVVDGEAEFFVCDNGMGIDPRHRERVFGLFDKLDPGSGGTGVGLALVRRIVELYGGRIRVESEGPGHGSCFIFTLPDTRRPAS